MSDQNKVLVRRFFEEVCNGRKLSLAEEVFAPDHVYHDPASPWVGSGPAGIKDLIGGYQSAFPDAHWRIDAMLESGDTVVTRWTGSGTHNGTLLGMPATGAKVQVPGIWLHRIAGGKIAESWNVWDTLGMFQQLGRNPVTGYSFPHSPTAPLSRNEGMGSLSPHFYLCR